MTVRGYQLGVDWFNVGDPASTGEDDTSDVEDGDLTMSWGRDTSQAASVPVAGQFTFALRNDTGRYSPENVTSPLFGNILPGRRALFQHTNLAGSTIRLFDGVLDAITADPNPPATFTGECLDGWGRPGAEQLSTQVYTGLRTGDAINIILDAIGWMGARRIDPGVTVMPYWWAEGEDAASAIEKLINSEGPPALAYVQGGTFVFEDRHHRLLSPRSVFPQGLFTHLSPPGSLPATASDTFGRTVGAGSWGSADVGGAWTLTGTAADFSVSTGQGRISMSATNSERRADLAATIPNPQLEAVFSLNVIATGAPVSAYLVARNNGAGSYYLARLSFSNTGNLFVSLERFVGGVFGPLAGGVEVDTGITYTANTGYRLRMVIVGQTISAVAWPDGQPAPATFQISTVDNDPAAIDILDSLAASKVGVRGFSTTGNTNTVPLPILSVDNFTVTIAQEAKMLRGTISYDHGLTRIVNSAAFTVEERTPDPQAEIWSSDTPVTIGSGQSFTVFVTASNPFANAITPVQGADLTVDSGTVTASLSRDSGVSTILTITASADAIISRMAVTATPITVAREVKITAEDASSVGLSGRNSWDRDVPWCNRYDAQAIANRIVATYAINRPVVVFEIQNIDTATMTQIRDRALSDRITIRDDTLGVAADYMVEKVAHTITDLNQHRLQLTCEVPQPTQPGNVFTFDVAGMGFNDGLFGVDGVDSGANVFLFDMAGHGFNQGVFGT